MFHDLIQLALARDRTEATYRDVLARLPQGQKILEQAYTAVEKVINDVADYVGEWLRYQVLIYKFCRIVCFSLLVGKFSFTALRKYFIMNVVL